MAAAQSDAALRDAMAAYMTEQDLGPHRGVAALGDYLAAEQAAGRVRDGVDPHAVAMLLVGACYTRAAQRQMPAEVAELPGTRADHPRHRGAAPAAGLGCVTLATPGPRFNAGSAGASTRMDRDATRPYHLGPLPAVYAGTIAGPLGSAGGSCEGRSRVACERGSSFGSACTIRTGIGLWFSA